jgi:hypothetical protein
VERRRDRWRLVTVLLNMERSPALMVRLKAVREKSGDRILPALYTDNYLVLLPRERRTVTTELLHSDTRGERLWIVVDGFNVHEVKSGPTHRSD